MFINEISTDCYQNRYVFPQDFVTVVLNNTVYVQPVTIGNTIIQLDKNQH